MNLDDLPDDLCAWCGKPFVSKQYRQRFCSTKCNKAEWSHKKNEQIKEERRQARTDYVCPECGVTFTPSRVDAIFCCELHRARSRSRERYRREPEYRARLLAATKRYQARKRAEAKASHVPSHVPLASRGHMGGRV